MNERIRELARQAGIATEVWHKDAEGHGYKTANYQAEKFAELIVREMCNVLDKAQWDKGEDWVCADGTRIIPQVKEHFGVKE
jgi:hypothetical protein